jgi:hypothetical protein
MAMLPGIPDRYRDRPNSAGRNDKMVLAKEIDRVPASVRNIGAPGDNANTKIFCNPLDCNKCLYRSPAFYFFLFSRCESALPAEDLESLPVRLSLRTLEALDATLGLVIFLAITCPPIDFIFSNCLHKASSIPSEFQYVKNKCTWNSSHEKGTNYSSYAQCLKVIVDNELAYHCNDKDCSYFHF